MLKYIPVLALLLLRCTYDKSFDFRVLASVNTGVWSEIAKLVVTDEGGNIVSTIYLENGEPDIDETVAYRGAHADHGRFDFHLIRGDAAGQSVTVMTVAAVSSGERVVFEAENYATGERDDASFVLFVDGIPPDLDGWSMMAADNIDYHFVSSPNQHTLGLKIHLDTRQSLVLHFKPLLSGAVYRACFLPDSLARDTIYANVASFPQLQPPRTILGLDGYPSTNIHVAAVSPDFAHYANLLEPEANANLEFYMPPEIPEPVAFCVQVSTAHWYAEKIFSVGEQLRFDEPDIRLEGKSSKAGKSIQVETSGPVDMIKASSVMVSDGMTIQWSIQGPPEAFLPYRLPEIWEMLPPWAKPDVAFAMFEVTLVRSEQLGYSDFREGLPYRSGDLFAIARSGFLLAY